METEPSKKKSNIITRVHNILVVRQLPVVQYQHLALFFAVVTSSYSTPINSQVELYNQQLSIPAVV